jgi:hypothetical protein
LIAIGLVINHEVELAEVARRVGEATAAVSIIIKRASHYVKSVNNVNSFGLKYQLYYGLGDGTSFVRFDNESGKGDHKHVGTQEESYHFIDVETLVADFLAEIEKARRK